MAPSKPPYDPIISVEGMYKGSLTRLGYLFKDPKHYGEATLAVLRETAKRYDDALDDCLIQILDAKWLLENQLAQNRARRAREAAETEMSSNKRKAVECTTDEKSSDSQAPQMEETPAKRIKVQHNPRNTTLPPTQTQQGPMENGQSLEPVQNAKAGASEASNPGMATVEDTGQKAGLPGDQDIPQGAVVQEGMSSEVTELPLDKPHEAPTEEPKEQDEQMHRADRADQTGNDEDLNFESMFGDANGGNDQNNDLNFDLNLNPDHLVGANPLDSTTHDANNLELLPGLESYANASTDDFSMLNLPPSTGANQSGIRRQENNFELPEIQGDSNFNDLFADGDFEGDAALVDLDLDDGFFNP